MILITYASDVRLIALQNYFKKNSKQNTSRYLMYMCTGKKKHNCMIRIMCV